MRGTKHGVGDENVFKGLCNVAFDMSPSVQRKEKVSEQQ